MNKSDKKRMRQYADYVLMLSELKSALSHYEKLTCNTNGLFENCLAKTLAEDIGMDYKFSEFHELLEKTNVFASELFT